MLGLDLNGVENDALLVPGYGCGVRFWLEKGLHICCGQGEKVPGARICDRGRQAVLKVLVTGGRAYGNRARLYQMLDEIHVAGITCIVHGGAGYLDAETMQMVGADLIAGHWASERLVPVRVYEVTRTMWRTQGRRAGPWRNRDMLTIERPDLVLSAPGGKGTADCVRQAKAMGIQVMEFTDD